MQLHHGLAIVAAGLIRQAPMALSATSINMFNGWYKCSTYTVLDGTDKSDNDADCAMFEAPLCYPGICEAPANARSTIDVFVKRMPASRGKAEKASNVWLIAGGPGAPSTDSKSTLYL